MISPKYTALSLLIIQNASVSMLTRLSRTTPSSLNSPTLYNPSAAVFVAEIIKFAVSLGMLVLDQSRSERLERSRRRKEHGKEGEQSTGESWWGLMRQALVDLVTIQKGEVMKLSIPAALYAAQNTLLYIALSNLDAATYQTTYQLKLLSSALFSVLFFSRSLSLVKWFSLFLLTAGVAIVQLEGVTTSSSSSISHNGGTSRVEDQVVGLAAILAACITSGLAGGYFEYVLKSASTTAVSSTSRSDVKKVTVTTPPTLWTRNLQLSIPSLSFSLLFLLLSSPSPSTTPLAQLSNIFDGFSPLVWSVVLNQAVGGLLVAMVIREADGVAKGFATSIAIIVSTISSSIFYSILPGTMFISGATLVILSTIIYARDDQNIKARQKAE